MNPSTQNRLYTIDRTIRTVLKITTVVCIVLLFLAAFITPWRRTIACVFFVTGAFWALLIVCRLCLSPFVKSDEEEEMEQKVEYILKKHHADALRTIPDYSPLCNLTPEQEERVKQLLRELPTMDGKPDYVYMSRIAQYLTALEQLGKVKLNNRYALQKWIEQVTGKRTPDYNHFNEAIPCKSEKKVAKACEELSRLLQ